MSACRIFVERYHHIRCRITDDTGIRIQIFPLFKLFREIAESLSSANERRIMFDIVNILGVQIITVHLHRARHLCYDIHVNFRIRERHIRFTDPIQVPPTFTQVHYSFVIHVFRANELTPDSRIVNELNSQFIVETGIRRDVHLQYGWDSEREVNDEITSIHHLSYDVLSGSVFLHEIDGKFIHLCRNSLSVTVIILTFIIHHHSVSILTVNLLSQVQSDPVNPIPLQRQIMGVNDRIEASHINKRAIKTLFAERLRVVDSRQLERHVKLQGNRLSGTCDAFIRTYLLVHLNFIIYIEVQLFL